jgi:hypothetical protein
VEVKIGVKQNPREVVLDSAQTQDEIEQLVGAALKEGSGLLSLTDVRGRRVMVSAEQIAYVEIAEADGRRVGFTVS